MKDHSCPQCDNRPHCAYLPYRGRYCPGLECLIGHNKSGREMPAADLMGEGYEGYVDRDYKARMIEGWEAGDRVREMSVEDIRVMPASTAKQARIGLFIWRTHGNRL